MILKGKPPTTEEYWDFVRKEFKEKDLFKAKYITLEQDLIKCFEERNIKVKKLTVDESATKYIIEVIRT